MTDLDQGTGLDITITRALNALALHLAGATDAAIAKQLGFQDAATARRAWEMALADTVTPDERERARRTENARLDRLQQAAWSKAIDNASPEQAQFIRLSLQIMERRSRMNGLDAATRVEVYTPTSAEIARFLGQVRIANGELPEIEGEVLDDDAHVAAEGAA